MTPVKLNTAGGYFDRMGSFNIYDRWLTERGIEFTVIKNTFDGLPMALIFEDQDALAFKLKFNL